VKLVGFSAAFVPFQAACPFGMTEHDLRFRTYDLQSFLVSDAKRVDLSQLVLHSDLNLLE
jgi:hypothetical protein